MKHFLKHRYREVQSVDIPCKLPQAVDNITNTGRQTTINDKREDMHKSNLQSSQMTRRDKNDLRLKK